MEDKEIKRLSEEYSKVLGDVPEAVRYLKTCVYGVYELEYYYGAIEDKYPILTKTEKAISLLKDGNEESKALMEEVCQECYETLANTMESLYETLANTMESLYKAGNTRVFEVVKECIEEREEKQKEKEMKVKAF